MPLTCTLCEFCTNDKTNMTKHTLSTAHKKKLGKKKNVDVIKATYQCNFCNDNFNTKASLNIHKNNCIKSLCDKNKLLEEKNKSLEETIRSLKSEINTVESTYDSFKENVMRLQSELNRANERVDNYLTILSASNNLIRQTSPKLLTINAHIEMDDCVKDIKETLYCFEHNKLFKHSSSNIMACFGKSQIMTDFMLYEGKCLSKNLSLTAARTIIKQLSEFLKECYSTENTVINYSDNISNSDSCHDDFDDVSIDTIDEKQYVEPKELIKLILSCINLVATISEKELGDKIFASLCKYSQAGLSKKSIEKSKD